VKLFEREPQLEALYGAVSDVRGGDGRVVVVSGEAGLGKTVLLEQLVRRLDGGPRVLVGRCDDLFAPRPLGPFVDVARRVGGELGELCKRPTPRRGRSSRRCTAS
jgi:predicted ATPase